MSKYTAEQYIAVADIVEGGDTRHPGMIADMLRQAAAYLAQPEWSSEEDVRECLDYIGFPKGLDGEYAPSTLARMRAALQSVRPPVGVVSDEEVTDRVAKAIADASGHGMREKCEHLAHAAISAYRLSTWPATDASRHAPTKD